ncbi:MinD-like ATPase involved in chromosome partitioning or flagellar assembly [Kribbella orskensis]|uniref:MinD-like ATPase involved in chromosome partitioning or flagellar assembly n=1 Tax=Kribbella orskensis TaxID=2512216 RepID=A0ABY2BJ83_9ACTN|nr:MULTISPECIES: ParA family protein [Kribbella]TCN37902.1 MinD-like ATPase involved in chromosome partitioning or flagellar assembly [Kribbella sp. VKM Ac-2500]TCO19388.1 MinD-like ATPase involved in chromosome partitioning or flagellar assembly [Kribbella orskensis]
MTDSHNSGQHKDREAAAAEVRRMWQPTPSWTQPDPNGQPPAPSHAAPPPPPPSSRATHDPEPEEDHDVSEEAQPDALSEDFPDDSWSQPAPAQQAAADPWIQEAPEPERAESHGTAQQLSPAAQHFFPQGIPGQHAPQPDRQVSYRADELLQALPLPREAPAEKGVRGVLRLRPGTAERLERIARATAATAFRRPVTITIANPKGGSGKTPTTLLLAGALGQARGGGVVAWDNNELRGNMHLRTHDTNSRSTVTDLLQAMQMLTQPDARLGDVGAYLRHQVSGQYDVLTSATTTYAQIEARDFDQIHRLLSRFYKVLVIDTGNNEGSSNWREAMKASDVLVIPLKWKSLSCAAAVQMLEELDHQGPDAQRLIRRAVIAVSNGPGDVNKEVEKQLRPYFESRAAAVVDIPTDPHIAAEGPLDHQALLPATRRAALELAAKVAEQVTIALNVPR